MAKGKPPCEGIWEIFVDDERYYARFKNNKWQAGYYSVERVPDHKGPYERNNDPKRPIKWRGLID